METPVTNIRFMMELHKFTSYERPEIAHLEEECTSDGGANDFIAIDISEAFNPMDHSIKGAAFDIRFTLPEDFDSSSPALEKFREYGLEPGEVAELCRKVSDGFTLDDVREAHKGRLADWPTDR
jgi:hypothetical protein